MSGRDRLLSIRTALPAVLPSLLLCDFGNLERELARLESAGVRALHLDVMDGVFVPNFTYGMTIVEAIRKLTDLPLDVHLMMVQPERYVREFVAAGADILTVHAEAVQDVRAVVDQIHAAGAAAGVAVNPETPLSVLDNVWGELELALIMSVPAGFGGQAFQRVALDKLRTARERGGPDLLLEVDGGINRDTIRDCALAGADLFVVGSAIFRAGEYGSAIAGLQALASRGPG